MFVSPAEPEKLREGRTVSPLCEQMGCDFLFPANSQWVGIQRKTVADFIASLHDGRLAREVAQMQRITHRILIIEGQPRWTNEGEMMGRDFGQRWTRKQWRSVLWSVRAKGIWIEYTDSTPDTIETLSWIEGWFLKGSHRTLDRRPGPTSVWGQPTNRDYALHLVMGLPGVGPELAERIVDRFGVPFGWCITQRDLLTIDGIGKKKADTIWSALDEREEG